MDRMGVGGTRWSGCDGEGGGGVVRVGWRWWLVAFILLSLFLTSMTSLYYLTHYIYIYIVVMIVLII